MGIGLTFEDIQKLKDNSLQQGLVKKLNFIEIIQYSKLSSILKVPYSTMNCLIVEPEIKNHWIAVLGTAKQFKLWTYFNNIFQFVFSSGHDESVCYTTLSDLQNQLN